MTDPIAAAYSPQWLALREPADAAARSLELVDVLRRATPPGLVVHDLGCGTGSMARWLAPLLPGPQHWVLHDHDAGLLSLAAAGMPARSRDGGPVTAGTRRTDLAVLAPAELAGAGLVTASALLDVLTLDELRTVAAACAAGAHPALITLTVTGRVDLEPADPLDRPVAAAFDAHQRRVAAGRRLLGPDAVAAADAVFGRLGGRVDVRPSPWRLGPGDAALTEQWLRGRVSAAGEERPDLPTGAYLARRLAQLELGGLRVEVHHADLLVMWS